MKMSNRVSAPACLLSVVLFLFFSCRKEGKTPDQIENGVFEGIKREFFRQDISRLLVTTFNDSLNLLYVPDWDAAELAPQADSLTIVYVPLYARLRSTTAHAFYTIEQVNASRLLIAYRKAETIDFKIVTYTNQQNNRTNNRSASNPNPELTVLVNDIAGKSYVSTFNKSDSGYERQAVPHANEAEKNNSRAMKATTTVCYNVCTWGYYCPFDGYHVTVTINADGFCSSPAQASPCSAPWDLGNNIPIFPAWTVTYTEVRCVQGPPPPYGNVDDDPAHQPKVGGTYTSSTVPTRDFPVLPYVSDAYSLTCPSNFTFVPVTEHNLWQEAGITNAWVNLVYVNESSQIYIAKKITIPKIFFGLAYYDVNGKLLYSKQDAAAIAADAINWAEFRVRKAFLANPAASEASLRQIWIDMCDFYMRQFSKNIGRASLQGSLNPIEPIVIRPYTACR